MRSEIFITVRLSKGWIAERTERHLYNQNTALRTSNLVKAKSLSVQDWCYSRYSQS